jgi:molybdopterin/thiamine biosynthesis adenylyltransferase
MVAAGVPSADGGTPRVRLALSIDLVSRGDDVLLVRDGVRATHVLRSPNSDERNVLRELSSGFQTAPCLERAVDPVTVAEVIAGLSDAGALEWRLDADSSPITPLDTERFDRQLPYLGGSGAVGRAERIQRRLLDSHVTILGCGGLGSWVAQALVCAGIRRLRLIDADCVELSNLNRQPLYGERDLGRPKVEAARDALRRIDGAANIEPVPEQILTESDAVRRLGGTDVLVQTADWPPYQLEEIIDRACRRLGLAHITAGQQPPLIRIGPFSIPRRTPCHDCSERALEARHPLYESTKAARAANPRHATTLGTASGLIGTVIASEVMHALTGIAEPATLGRVMVLDLRTLDARWYPVDRPSDAAISRCTACSALSRD